MPPNAPPPFRSNTGEIDTLKGELQTLSTHLRGMADELSAERKARKDDKDRGISITNISVPLLLVLAVFGATVGSAIGVSWFVHEAKTHFADGVIHADHDKAIRRGGIAYDQDVKDEIASAASDQSAETRRVERAVKKGAQCRPSKIHGEFVCEFEDPETLKLHPP